MNCVNIDFSEFFCQEPQSRGERVCCGAGQSGGLPGVPPAAPGLFQGHLGLPVLPGHCQLPILLIEGTSPLSVLMRLCRRDGELEP